jgi:hypothetical protein
MIKSTAKRVISYFDWLHYLYIVITAYRFKTKSEKKYDLLRKEGCKVVSPLIAKNEILANYSVDNNAICHIIGSGWSLNHSCHSIKSSDFVIGFNQAALCPSIKFNVYFVEFGSSKMEDISKKQLRLINEVVKKQTAHIYFKNIWEDKNDIDFIIENWSTNISYIKDYWIPCLFAKNLYQSLAFFLENDNSYLKQYCSTVLTSILFAKFLGFKKIILHGVDFGGAYFFDVEGYFHLLQYRPNKEKEAHFYGELSKNNVHSTARLSTGLKNSLPIIHNFLYDQGIELFSATDISPSSEILPVFSSRNIT